MSVTAASTQDPTLLFALLGKLRAALHNYHPRWGALALNMM
jgi:hypothetical protein